MFMKLRLRLYTFLLSFIVVLIAFGAPKIEPDAPVIDFKLPFFAESGYKEWELSGREGRYLGNERLFVLLISIRIFSGKADRSLQSIIISPDATIDMQAKKATGSSALRMRGSNYRISGSDWIWLGKENRIIVRKDARVEFNESLKAILR